MGLYQRDFLNITIEEITEWEALKKAEEDDKLPGNLRKPSNYLKYPKAVRHYLSLFPNHFLDFVDLKEETKLHDLSDRYLVTLDDTSSTEAKIVGFIKKNEAHFVAASILKNYNFGHHDAYIIPEFWLGNTYRVDYLIIGENSGGYEFIFVELENPYGNITIQDGELGATFRKGINQVNDWKRYLASSYTTLEETFNKYKKLIFRNSLANF